MLNAFETLLQQDLSWLPARLKSLHYNIANISGLGDLTTPGQVDSASQQLLQHGPLGTLLRAFVLGTPVSHQDLELALGPDGPSRLIDAGLLTHASDALQARCTIGECYGAFTLADAYPTAERPTLEDGHVLNIGNASVLAAEFTVRTKCALAADIGCGQGLQSILLADHADKVIATDINPRALHFTRASAQMRGVADRIECRLGSLLDPLQGQRFNSIVSNPPFIIRDEEHGASAISADLSGDAAVEILARGVPAILADHGWFTMICNWHHSSDTGPEWSERPRSWFANSGTDVWIVRNQTFTAEHYGRGMIEMDGIKDGPAFDARTESWNRWCMKNQVKFVSFGIIIARRRHGANWMRVESIPMNHRRGAGSELVRHIFAGQTLLASLARPESLLTTRLRRGSTLQAVAIPPGTPNLDKLPPGSVQFQHTQGWAMPQPVAPDVSRFVQGFDGSRSCGEQAEQIIRALGGTPPGPEQLSRVLAGMVRSAFLVPVSATGEVLL